MGNRDATMGKKPKWIGSIVMLAALWCLAQSAWAVEYRLQMTNLDYRIFAAYMTRAPGSTREGEIPGGAGLRDRVCCGKLSAWTIPSYPPHYSSDPV